MRNDDALFVDMFLAARKARRFASGMTFSEFRVNEMVQSAIIRELQVIGEAARMVTEETRISHPEVDWRGIAGMRNRLVHEYFLIRLDIVWAAVQVDIPSLIAQLEKYVPPDLGIEA